MRQKILKLVTDGQYKEAMCLHTKLHALSSKPHKFTFPPLLKACLKIHSPLHLQILHCHVIKTGFDTKIHTSTSLLNAYMNLSLFDHALKVFDEMPSRNVASFNALISGFLRIGYTREAVSVFGEMDFRGFLRNSVTVASLLSGCGGRSVVSCMVLHCLGVKLGVEGDVYVGTSLVTLYFYHGEVVLATRVFEEMSNKSDVSYNAFFCGLLRNGAPSLVLVVFKDMRMAWGVKPNSVTLTSVFSACASLLYLQFGRQVHGLVLKNEGAYDATMVGTSLVDMYAKCGSWQCAHNLFSELNGYRNLMTWNAMIAGLMLNGQITKAVDLFETLDSEGLQPDTATWNLMIHGFAQLNKGSEALNFFKKMQSFDFAPGLKSVTSVLAVCAALTALRFGKEIHGYAIRTDMNIHQFVATALIDMYMKCGCASWARRVFDGFDKKPKDPAFWNATIHGYGRNGQYQDALESFELMVAEEVKPNATTFTGVLSACSHAGEVNKGWQVLRMMTEDYGSSPEPEHIGCIVDLLGRSGRLCEAMELIQDLEDPPPSVFASLLGACRRHLDPELGEEVALRHVQLKPQDPAPFVVLSNIYAELGRWGDVERIRDIIDEKGLRKLQGSTSFGVATCSSNYSLPVSS